MKKKGFTLIELLAVVMILAVVLVIAIPKMGSIISARKQQSFAASAKNICRQLSYANVDQMNFTSAKLKDLGFQLTDDYDKDGSIAYVSGGDIYVNLKGRGKFDGLYVCGAHYHSQSVTVQTTPCPSVQVYTKVDVNLNGGTSTQTLSALYPAGTVVTLTPPTRVGYTFDSWVVVLGNSTINGNNLTVGNTETLVYATWR